MGDFFVILFFLLYESIFVVVVAGWIVAATFYLYDVFIRLSVNVTVGDLESEFNITASGVTSYFSSSFFYAYAAVQLPVGIGLDFLGPRFTLMGASLLCAFGFVHASKWHF